MPREDIIPDESLEVSNGKINENFAELYSGLSEPVLWEEIEGKPEEYPSAPHEHEHFEDENNPHNTTREQVQAAPVYSQTINMMADSGRFGGKQNPLNFYTPGNFTPSSFFGSFNGSTISSAGKFIHENTTNGGTRGALTEDVSSLVAAMGRTGTAARQGVEFYICQITAGSGTASQQSADGYTGYLICSNGASAVFGFGSYATLACWVRIKSGEALIVPNRGLLRRNEIPVASGFALTPASGWAHINTQSISSFGFSGPFPFFGATEGAVIQIACPAVFAGQAFPGIHTNPLPTLNEMVAV